jgi:hypothetical protein
MRLCEKGWAVAAFISPAHTVFICAYESEKDAPVLPLFCYTAVGWHDDKFYVPAVRIEQEIRQECAGYDNEKINDGLPFIKSISAQPSRKTFDGEIAA